MVFFLSDFVLFLYDISIVVRDIFESLSMISVIGGRRSGSRSSIKSMRSMRAEGYVDD